MQRFEGLDRLRGLALLFMLVHHSVSWTGGKDRAHELLGFSDGMAVTDLAAPMFALAVGAAASLVGAGLRSAPGAKRWAVGRRWLTIAAWGVAIGVSRDLEVDSFGVLEVLVVVGVVTILLAALLRPSAAGWAAIAVVATLAAPEVLRRVDGGDDALGLVLAGGFPAVTYLAFAAWGAVAMAVQGGRERSGDLASMAIAGALATLLVHAWPPVRHPGDLQFVLPGVTATLAGWALLAALGEGRIAGALARAGRRTLLVFVGHYCVRIGLDLAGLTGELQGWGWTALGLAVAAGVFGLAALPERGRIEDGSGLETSVEGKGVATAGPVPSRR